MSYSISQHVDIPTLSAAASLSPPAFTEDVDHLKKKKKDQEDNLNGTEAVRWCM